MKKFNEIARRAFRCGRDATSIIFLRSFSKAFSVALLILAVALSTPFAYAESVVAKISLVKGAVQIVRNGKRLAASKGMAIKPHDEVITGADGSVTMVMPDHSLLHLGQSGTLFIGKSTTLKGFGTPSRSD